MINWYENGKIDLTDITLSVAFNSTIQENADSNAEEIESQVKVL